MKVDLKQPERIQFNSAICKYIRDSYGEDPTQYSDDIRALETLRNHLINLQPHASSITLLWYFLILLFFNRKYYSQLIYLSSKFPIKENEISILFSWKSSLDNGSMSSFDITFEKSNVLFNLAVLYGLLADEESRDVEGLKKANNGHLLATGLFSYLLDNPVVCTSCVDTSPPVLAVLKSVSLAKAQECFLLKSIQGGIKHSLISRIAKQASGFYLEAENNNSAFSDAQQMFASAKRLQLKSLACFYKGKASGELGKYGEELGFYEEADRSIKTAIKLKKVDAGLVEEIKRLGADISASIKRCVSLP
jgi:programmed cell death 6-interacting protein